MAALAGAVWLGVAALLGYLQLPSLDIPRWRSLPIPTWMLGGGVLLGVALALASRAFIAIGAAARARRADRRLRSAVATVAEGLVFAPIEEELAAYRRTREGHEIARG